MSDLMILPAAQLPRLSFTDVATQRKEGALATSALIERVQDSGEQDKAVQAQREIVGMLRDVESGRVEIKAPVLTLGREIDRNAFEFVADLVAELARIEKLLADFQSGELKRQAEARLAAIHEQERVERERLEQEESLAQQIERERHAALALAKSSEDEDRINEEACRKQKEEQERIEYEARRQSMAVVAAIPAPARSEGQSVRQDWDFEVVDIWQLARMHPGCVEVKPRRREIIDLLKMGNTVAGVRAFKTVKSGVRSTQRKDVEV